MLSGNDDDSSFFGGSPGVLIEERQVDSSSESLPLRTSSPVMFAVSVGDYKALVLFHENGVIDKLAPAYACYKGQQKCLEVCQELGYDLEHRHCSWTPAHLAAEHGHEGCLFILKQAGCNLERPDDDGTTPANLAEKYGHGGCLRVIHTAQ